MADMSAEPSFSQLDDVARRNTLRGGSRSFFAASLLLPRRLREPATALYAFCRLADDAIDTGEDCESALADLKSRLARIYEGRPLPIAADAALARVVAEFTIPKALPEALLEGFAWDAEGRRYEEISDLRAYAARVAGTVGAMMALLMGARSSPVVSRACDLGVAMQLTNIARDVGEDARAGRLYLPQRWLRDAGIEPSAWLQRPVFSEGLASVIRRVLDEADELYRRADCGITRLPPSCRPAIRTARWLYSGIGHEVARRKFDSLSKRAVVPGLRKVGCVLHGLMPVSAAGSQLAAPPLPETRFLVEAAGDATHGIESAPLDTRPLLALPRFGERLVWLLELFERLERQDRLGSSRT